MPTKIEEASELLALLRLPRKQQNERSALTLLALANIGRRGRWEKAQRPMLRIWDIMGYMRDHYHKEYAANSRETIRRQTIHQFEQARLVDRNPDDPSRPTNSGKTVYQLTPDALEVLRKYGTRSFDSILASFINRYGALEQVYAGSRAALRVPLQLPDGRSLLLSPGRHNQLQVAIVESFGPIFAPGAELLYLGDSERKQAICNVQKLESLDVKMTEHDKLPDVILYLKSKDWLFLVEAVTSHGPISPKRHREMKLMLRSCKAGPIFVTAFLTVADFRKFSADIAWETEVWVADNPEHLIHFNGPRFLGPYEH
jgi:adenine-specific DNA-methyltransferase